MEERLWYKFTEYNDNEGETWHFFVKLTKVEHLHLKILLETAEFLGDSYTISDKEFSEAVIQTLVENTDSGYYDTYNKCQPPYSTDILSLKEEDAEDWLYKAQIWM